MPITRKARRAPNRLDSAFTLIELMVVVSIIAVLVSILLPSLAAAREQGRIVKCAAQLRQIGMAAVHYADDQGGYVPGNYWPAFHALQKLDVGQPEPNKAYVLFAEVFVPYLGGPARLPPGIVGNNGDGRDAVLATVFAKMPVFQCPSWPGVPVRGISAPMQSRRGDSSPRPGPVRITGQSLTYAVSGWDFINEKHRLGPDGYYTGGDGRIEGRGLVLLERVPRPSEVIFVTDGNVDNLPWQSFGTHDILVKNHLWNGGDARMIDDVRHASGKNLGPQQAKANSLFFDGHVDTRRLATISAHDFSPYQRPPSDNGDRGIGTRRQW